jgi:hypothetical protein
MARLSRGRLAITCLPRSISVISYPHHAEERILAAEFSIKLQSLVLPGMGITMVLWGVVTWFAGVWLGDRLIKGGVSKMAAIGMIVLGLLLVGLSLTGH